MKKININWIRARLADFVLGLDEDGHHMENPTTPFEWYQLYEEAGVVFSTKPEEVRWMNGDWHFSKFPEFKALPIDFVEQLLNEVNTNPRVGYWQK